MDLNPVNPNSPWVSEGEDEDEDDAHASTQPRTALALAVAFALVVAVAVASAVLLAIRDDTQWGNRKASVKQIECRCGANARQRSDGGEATVRYM